MIVDIHTHIFPPRLIEERARLSAADVVFGEMYGSPRARMATAEDLIASMDGAGVDTSVAAGFWWRDPALRAEHAAYLLAAAARYPGRIVPFVPQPAREAAASAAGSGATGSGELRVADPAAIELRDSDGWPLLVHCSEEVGHAYGGKAGGLTPGALWRLLDTQPRARVIAAHWGGGFPFYALMPEVRAIIDSGRLVFDTAASPLLYAPETVRRGIDLVGVGAVCWGSDFPLRDQSQDRAAIEAVLAPGAERDAVLGETRRASSTCRASRAGSDDVRLFIALEVPETWRAAAAAQQQALIGALPPEARRALRPVRAELMHITLRFLGEVDEGGIDPLQAALDAVPPFEVALSLERAGTFGPAPRTGVVWLGIDGDVPALQHLAGEVEQAVRVAGIRADERPYSAHLTLARLARQATVDERVAVAAAVHALPAPPPVPFTARELVLVRSYLEGPAPRYEVLSRHP